MHIALLTAIAMVAFAANSVLARLALASGSIDAMSYTGIRLASGALLLFAMVQFSRRNGSPRPLGGSWAGAAALFSYAIAFSVAYLMVGAGMGALILFASVQMSMLGWAVAKGDRPGALEWLGIGLAIAALAYLVSPGLTAPSPLGTFLMAAAGAAWAAYSLIGRGSTSPLIDTAGNFIRCLPFALLLLALGLAAATPSAPGILYAVLSGAIASGLGYAVWHLVLPRLSRITASTVQLTVPAIAALGGVLLLAEPITLRLALASAGILGGVALALFAAERRKR